MLSRDRITRRHDWTLMTGPINSKFAVQVEVCKKTFYFRSNLAAYKTRAIGAMVGSAWRRITVVECHAVPCENLHCGAFQSAVQRRISIGSIILKRPDVLFQCPREKDLCGSSEAAFKQNGTGRPIGRRVAAGLGKSSGRSPRACFLLLHGPQCKVQPRASCP